MPDAEKKKIADLSFNINDAINSLDTIDKKLKTIADTSEKYAKKIGGTINSVVDSKNIQKNIMNVEKSYEEMTTYEKNRAADVAAYREKQEIKTTEALKREHDKQIDSVQTLSDKISNYAKTYLIYQGFNKLKNGISETIDEMVNLESEMVQIDRVLNENELNIDNYRDKLLELAYDYGNSMDNVTDVALRLAQAGYDSNEVLALTAKTLLALNTAELDATQATDDMVAVMAQWGLMTGSASEQAQQYGDIIDKINKVADNYPTTSADILDALKKTSSAFNIAGASIDETIASITAAEIASQRGGKVIGTALSNISQQIKDVTRVDIAESLGISFFKDEAKTEYKSIIEIFEELSNKMEELKKAGKESSTEMQTLLSVFTVFRRNIGASLLGEMSGEFSTFDEIMKDITESAGYSLQENTKYMNTMAAAQEQFNAKLLQLKTEVWDNKLENVYRDLLNAGSGVIEWLSKLSNSAIAIPRIIGLITVAFSLLDKKMNGDAIKKYISQLGNLKKAFQAYNSTINSGKKVGDDFYKQLGNDFPNAGKKYLQSLNNGSAGLVNFAAKTMGAKLAQIGLNLVVAAGEAALTFGLSLAIQGVVKVIDGWIHASENAAKAMDEANSQLTDSNKKLNDYADNIETLRKEMSDSNITQEEFNKKKNDLKSIEKELIELYGDDAEGIDLVNGKIDEQINKVKELGKQDYLKYLSENYKDIKKVVNDVQKDRNDTFNFSTAKNAFFQYDLDEFEEYKKNLQEVLKDVDNVEFYDFGFGKNFSITAKGNAEEIINTYRNVFNKIDEYSKKVDGEEQEFLNKSLSRLSSNISSLNKKYGESIEEYNNFLLQRLQYDELYSDNYAKILEARAKLEKAIETGNQDEIDKAKENITNVYKDAINSAANDPLVSEGMINILTEQLDGINEEIDKQEIGLKIGIKGDHLFDSIQEALDEMGDISLEDLQKGFETGEITDNMQKLKNILDESGISVENFIKFFNVLGFALGDTNAVINETTDGIEKQKAVIEMTFDDLDTLIDKYGQVKAAVDEYNQTGSLTYDTLNSLINNNLLQYLDLTSDKLAINEAAFANAASAAKANAMYQLAAQAATEIASIAYGEQASAVSGAASSTSGMSEKTRVIYNKLIEVIPQILKGADAWTEYNKAMSNIDMSGLSDDATNKIQNVVRNLATMTTSLNNIKVSSISYARTSAKGSGGSGSSSSNSDAEKAAEEAKKAEEEKYKNNLSIFENYVSEKERLEQRWVNKQKDLGLLSNNDFAYITQQRIERYKQYLNQVNKMTWLSEEDRLKLTKEYQEKIEDLQVDYLEYLEDELDDEIDALEKANKEKIQLIKDEAEERINALKKVKEETSRIRDEEDYDKERQEILEEISYWEQRTGREAVEALGEAREKLAELDEEWKQQLEDWSIEDQIQAIEDERDAEIKAIEDSQEAEIKALQEAYDARVKLYAETGQLIYDQSVIESSNLYNAYKTNFVNPIMSDLDSIQKKIADTSKPATTDTAKAQYETYNIKSGDTLSGIAKRYNTTVAKIMEANPYVTNANKIYAGKTLQIPKFHDGGIVGGANEAFALLKPNEVILKPEWAEGINKLAEMAKHGDTITTSNTTIEVNGDLVKIDANIKNKSDAEYVARQVEKMLKDKFNIKK